MPKTNSDPAPAPGKPRPSSKIAVIAALLRRSEGATLDELTGATGWQPHTTRAALTGLKKKGHEIEREKVDGTSHYRITNSTDQ